MESIKVDTDEVRRVASNVDDIATEYETTYKSLLNNVEQFTSTDWTGDDATSFKNKVFDFTDDLNKMKTLMNEYADALRTFANNYEETQSRVKSQSQGLQS